MSISLIAALDNDTVIGKNGQMPWHLPDDLKRFKELTIGKHVLMGYNTAISIGRALPERTNLVLSRRHTAPFPGQETVRSIPEAQVLAGGTGLMVIGGGEVYRETLPARANPAQARRWRWYASFAKSSGSRPSPERP
jgi:dihydrofolate reductase